MLAPIPAPSPQPSKRRRRLRIAGVATLVVVLGLGSVAWSMWPSVEEIPEQLEEIDPEVDIAALELPAQGPMPAVRLGDLRGKKVFLVIEGRESFGGSEGKRMRRALHRWVLPDDVVGFSVGDAPSGAKLMASKIEDEFVGPMRTEMKLPIYIDYGGKFTGAFKLPAGHFGFVLLDEQGEVLRRIAGDASEDEIAAIAAELGAMEPPPGPPAPEFRIGELDNQACAGKHCVLVFLDRKVLRSEIPGLEQGGFESEDMKASFEQIRKPSVRFARMLAADWKAEQPSELAGVIVGEGEGWEVPGWSFVPEAADARAAFGVGEQAGMVIVDPEGRVAFSATGLVPFWQLSLAADLLGIETTAYGKRKEKKYRQHG